MQLRMQAVMIDLGFFAEGFLKRSEKALMTGLERRAAERRHVQATAAPNFGRRGSRAVLGTRRYRD